VANPAAHLKSGKRYHQIIALLAGHKPIRARHRHVNEPILPLPCAPVTVLIDVFSVHAIAIASNNRVIQGLYPVIHDAVPSNWGSGPRIRDLTRSPRATAAQRAQTTA
jgi:hypothetical protein